MRNAERILPTACTATALAVLLTLSTGARAEIFTETFYLCDRPSAISCAALKFWRLGDSFSENKTLMINLKVRDADESSLDYGVTFRNQTDCKLDVNGSFLRGDRAVAVVEWGTLILEPGEEISGTRAVHRLSDMRIGEGIFLSLRAASFDCRE
jgi:hypothetical protein